MVCGGDGCGGTCGVCEGGFVCTDGACVEAGAGGACGGVSYEGCCDETILKYCENNQLTTADCGTQGGQCGWDPGSAYYSCVAESVEDPTGTHPIDCP